MIAENKNMLNLLAYAAAMGAEISAHIQEDDKSFDSSIMNQNTYKMVTYIHKHYADNISVNDIASSGAVCRSKCCKLFNKVIGQTPNIYLRNYRISKSCQLLLETDRSINEIANACGFQSASYFIAVFKKEMGVSPQKYRKNIVKD
ncbi:MAG: AraC family transcriptional regulator [Clostridium sp.]|nr:AraC family transcriptional regulator [Clostridium sp.]